MAYLSFVEYSQLGGTVDGSTFYRLEYLARKLVDSVTHGRVVDETPVRDAVRYAMVGLIDALASDEQHGGREVQSVGNDGTSVTYAIVTGDVNTRYVAIARTYLDGEITRSGVPLLYAGVTI